MTLFLTALISATHPSINSASVTVSMSSYDDNLSPYEFIYMPGNHQNWTPATAPTLSPIDRQGNYDGMLALYTGGVSPAFKFTPAPSWEVSWGGTLAELDPAGGDIVELSEGFYRMQLNVAQMSATATPITLVGIMGNIVPGNDWATDTPMVMDAANNYLWSLTGTFQAGEYKFRFNGSWDFNLGGSLDGLTEGGDNLRLSAGTYTITLNLSKLPYTATVVAQ